jgi:hypothetical protein
MDRVRFITHKGKQVLLVDYTNCTRQTLLDILHERARMVMEQPKGSVLLLVDVTGVETSKEVTEEVKKIAVQERDRVKRSATVGMESVPKVYFDAVKNFAGREYTAFPTREAALDWLVSDEQKT